MARTLHLTNGSAIVDKIRAAGISDPIVPWNDVLHEGPVPAGLNPAALRQVRADFLAASGAGSSEQIARGLEERDAALDGALGGGIDEIVLWFEHDLYDQLHLIQILDRAPVDGGPAVTMVPATTYLGHIPAAEFAALFHGRQPVTSTQRIAARDAWQAFRSPNPTAVGDALARVTALPHLAPALRRHLEQFPSLDNGLSRTEQQTLEAVADGPRVLGDVFIEAGIDREDPFFFGDAGFLFHVAPLIRSSQPLLTIEDGSLDTSSLAMLGRAVTLTDAGTRVMRRALDRVAFCGIDRWLGGVRLHGNGQVWRWDASRDRIRFV